MTTAMHPMDWDEEGVSHWVLQELPLGAPRIIPQFHANAVDGGVLWYLGQDAMNAMNLGDEDAR
eukprot:241649-Rhodomonas_salina.1